MTNFQIAVLALGILAGISSDRVLAQPAAVLSVVQQGEGYKKADAERDAVRHALVSLVDHCVPNSVDARNPNVVLAREVLLARPEFVLPRSMRKVTAEEEFKGKWYVTVAVTVPKERLDRYWQEADEFLRWFKRPKVAVFVDDGVSDHGRLRKRADTECVAQAVREALQARSFEVVVPSQFEAGRKARYEKLALTTNDLELLKQIATEEAADLFIKGFGMATRAQGNRWQSSAQLEMFWTDSASSVATASQSKSGGASIQAALENVGKLLADDFMTQVFRRWSVYAFEGRTVEITVLGCTEDQEEALRDGLRGLERACAISELLAFHSAYGKVVASVKTKLASWDLFTKTRDIAKQADFKLRNKAALHTTIVLQAEL